MPFAGFNIMRPMRLPYLTGITIAAGILFEWHVVYLFARGGQLPTGYSARGTSLSANEDNQVGSLRFSRLLASFSIRYAR